MPVTTINHGHSNAPTRQTAGVPINHRESRAQLSILVSAERFSATSSSQSQSKPSPESERITSNACNRAKPASPIPIASYINAPGIRYVQRFFQKTILQQNLSHRLFQLLVPLAQLDDFTRCRFPLRIPGQSFLPGLKKFLAPPVVECAPWLDRSLKISHIGNAGVDPANDNGSSQGVRQQWDRYDDGLVWSSNGT